MTNINELQRIEKSEARRLVYVDNRPRNSRHNATVVIHIEDRVGYTKGAGDRDYPYKVTVCNHVFDIGGHVTSFAELYNPSLKCVMPEYTLCKHCAKDRAEFEAADKEWAKWKAKMDAEYKARQEREETERRTALEAQKASVLKLYEALQAAGFEVGKGNQDGQYPETMLNIKFDNLVYQIR
jgi:hypothetical protein